MMSSEDRESGEVEPGEESRGESSDMRVRMVCNGSSGNQLSI